VFQTNQTPDYAGFWIRFLAYLIDTVVMSAVLLPLGAVLGVVMVATDAGQNASILALEGLIRIVSIIVGWLYFALLESSPWQATVGKKLLGLRVIDLNGNRISFGKASGRYFGKILSTLILFIGFIMVAFSDKKQALHDVLAGTLVVKGTAMMNYPEPPPPPDFNQRGGTLGLG
jgi:uncharacterized RDD family membrane protein YckC